MTELRLYRPDELGPDGYPTAWHQTIKHAIREQADHRCIRCGHPYHNGQHGAGEWSPCDHHCTHRGLARLTYRTSDGSEVVRYETRLGTEAGVVVGYGKQVEAAWRILTVHHLDGDKADCRWWNLAALCQRCHLQIQGKVQMDRIWPWEHTPWFRPYVAGYYAWAYQREDLTRDQTMDRLEELLALERQATLGAP